MDLEEARRVLYTRLQCLEPSNVLKIMGYLLIQDIGEQDVRQLALSPDSIFQAFVAKAKSDLGLLCTPKSSSSASSSSSDATQAQQDGCIYTAVNSSSGTSNEDKAQQQSQHLQQPQQQQGGPLLSLSTSMHERQSGTSDLGFESFARTERSGLVKSTSPPIYLSQLYELLSVQQQQEKMSRHQVGDYELCGGFSATSTATVPGTGFHLPFLTRSSSSSTSSSDVNPSSAQMAWKPCVYFARGYCKHGSGCRFLHVPGRTPSFSSLSDDSQDSQGTGADFGFHSESVEHLEAELRELLTGKRSPVSIASLPQLYYERFGKTLQAEGYLTESQRHGKAGFSLTKLLARLKSTVTLIDRPHGQHAVVLAEDAHKFMAYRGDSEDLGSLAVNPSSRQIYLTFPAESSFSEEDVTTHFSAYGPVQDVRIPYQQKRMFGFVTFTYSETVRTILAEGNPHYICGARVLVKPYKEKGKHGDKKSSERLEQQAKQLHYRNLERNRQNVLRYYLQEQVGAAAGRGVTDEEVTAALQHKLAELHFANVQKRISETSMSKVNTMTTAPTVPKLAPALVPTPTHSASTLLEQDDMNACTQDFQQQPNPYDFVLNILDADSVDESSQGDPSKEQCGLSQSDQKALANAGGLSSLPPTFFANDMF